MDLTRIATAAELAAEFDRLRGNKSYRALAKDAQAAPMRDGRQPALPSSTLSDLLGGRSVPSRDTVVTFLSACGVREEDQTPWLAAWQRVVQAHHRAPPGAVRVREAHPRLLGVHAAIQASSAGPRLAGDELPAYVRRDLDPALRTAITAASERGGFVLLIGGSSVGKTRALFEMVKDVLPDWWLLHPGNADAVREFAMAPTRRTVLWLDELQRYLDEPASLAADAIRRVVNSSAVVVATIWPDEYNTRTRRRSSGQPDPHANDRELLGIAEVIAVPDTFSADERLRAEALASDQRIRVALDTPDAGFTQVMAAGPALVRWWEQAPIDQCYGKAVITAALDARRVGARAALTREYLAAAAPGYLTPAQQATAPADWLDQALAYATASLSGATAALIPVPAGMGRIAGYEVADFLHQHALRLRRTVHLPDSAWSALVGHHHPDDTLHLADSAERRGRDAEAAALYEQAIVAGSHDADFQLAALLLRQGRLDELARRATSGDRASADRLMDHMVERQDFDDLPRRASAGDAVAARLLARWLTGQNRIDEAIAVLHPHSSSPALATSGQVAVQLSKLLVRRGRIDEAIAILRPHADRDPDAAYLLAEQLVGQRNLDEAIVVLRHLSAAVPAPRHVAARLGELLIKQGYVDEAVTVLRPYADNGDRHAAERLATLLIKHDRIGELTQRADDGDDIATAKLAHLLARHGRTEELTQRANNGDRHAAERLATLLIKHDRIGELTQRADNGDNIATQRLIDLLSKNRCFDELSQRAHGDPYAAKQLARLLIMHGRLDEVTDILTQHANSGDPDAANDLAELLVRHGRVEELTERANSGDPHAAYALADLLAQQGDVDGAITILLPYTNTVSATPPRPAMPRPLETLLVDLLARQGRVEELTERANNGDFQAARALADLHARQGRIDEAISTLRSCASDDHGARLLHLQGFSRLVRLLVEHGRFEELDAEVAAGTYGAAPAYRDLSTRSRRRALLLNGGSDMGVAAHRLG